jgi:hypothetical protein
MSGGSNDFRKHDLQNKMKYTFQIQMFYIYYVFTHLFIRVYISTARNTKMKVAEEIQ